MDGSLGDNVGVESVAEVDGVDVVAFQVRVPVPPPSAACSCWGIAGERESGGSTLW